MLFNPEKRPDSASLLRHPYVVEFHKPEEELECDKPGGIRIALDDNKKLTVQDYRDRLYTEVLKKKKEHRRMRRRQTDGEAAAAGGRPSSQGERYRDDGHRGSTS